MSSSPGLAATVRPSRLMAISSVKGSVKGAPPLFDVDEELVSEHADGRGDRRGDGRTHHADGRLLRGPGHAGGDVVAEIHEKVEIFLAPGAILNSVHDALEPTRALPARRALPAGLAGEELGDAPGRPDHAGGRVHDDHRAGAQHGTGRADLVLPEREIDLVVPEPRGRHPAGDERLEDRKSVV